MTQIVVIQLTSLLHNSHHCRTTRITVIQLTSLLHNSHHCCTTRITVTQLASLSHNSHHCRTTRITVAQLASLSHDFTTHIARHHDSRLALHDLHCTTAQLALLLHGSHRCRCVVVDPDFISKYTTFFLWLVQACTSPKSE